jgi:hypothetical protein
MTDRLMGPRQRRTDSTLTTPILSVAFLVCVSGAGAQSDSDPIHGAAGLDAKTGAAVERIVNAAAAEGLPPGPLRAKALEGASKQAPADRIILVVDQYRMAMAAARAALGGHESSEAELMAAATAIRAGIVADAITTMRSARGGHSITVPLVVLADLVGRGVPPDSATIAMRTLVDRTVTDADLWLIRDRVEQDIRLGTAPGTAALLRAGATKLPPPTGPPSDRSPSSRPTPGGLP